MSMNGRMASVQYWLFEASCALIGLFPFCCARWIAAPNSRRLFLHCVDRAFSRTELTAGRRRLIKIVTAAMTSNSSTSVKPPVTGRSLDRISNSPGLKGRTARLRKGPQIQRDEHRQERQSEFKKFIYPLFQAKTPLRAFIRKGPADGFGGENEDMLKRCRTVRFRSLRLCCSAGVIRLSLSSLSRVFTFD